MPKSVEFCRSSNIDLRTVPTYRHSSSSSKKMPITIYYSLSYTMSLYQTSTQLIIMKWHRRTYIFTQTRVNLLVRCSAIARYNECERKRTTDKLFVCWIHSWTMLNFRNWWQSKYVRNSKNEQQKILNTKMNVPKCLNII